MVISSLFLSRCVIFFNFPCSQVSFPRARLTVRREVHLATRVSNLWPIRSNASAQTTPHSASSERGREKERITKGKGEIIDVVVQEKHRASSSGKFGSPERRTPLGGVRMAAIVSACTSFTLFMDVCWLELLDTAYYILQSLLPKLPAPCLRKLVTQLCWREYPGVVGGTVSSVYLTLTGFFFVWMQVG